MNHAVKSTPIAPKPLTMSQAADAYTRADRAVSRAEGALYRAQHSRRIHWDRMQEAFNDAVRRNDATRF